MRITQAREEHLDQMCLIMDQAKAQLRDMGVNQWQSGYPSREIWVDDISHGRVYVLLDDAGDVLGQFVYQPEPDPSYGTIDGSWLSSEPYACMHRVCVSADSKGKGLAGKMFEFVSKRAAQDGFSSVRIDTHADNVPMQRALSKAGFEQCGIIHLVGGCEDGAARIAFEKVL